MKEYKSQLPEISLKFKTGEQKNFQIKTSKDVFEVAKTLLNLDTVELVEEFLVIYVNKVNRSLGWIRNSTGGITGTVVDLRLIFIPAILSGAAGLICIHNHPSCNLKPSQQDIDLTKRIKESAKILDMVLMDHLIISGDLEQFYSFADEGML